MGGRVGAEDNFKNLKIMSVGVGVGVGVEGEWKAGIGGKEKASLRRV